ncbi:unnamed protein product [Protopolystoma xenopodis]|uniref:Uncharacterized protein n=1 Tax=Protopolystoma xenopodis TaxID=117903 RepID=A0A3S5B737_9PLAT|nr:unnamed protein product [Protopolystoma xenopodis]
MNETRRSYHHHHHHHHHYRNQFAVTSDISKSGSLNMSSMHASTAALAKIIEGSGIGILGAGSRKYRQAAEVRDREEDLEEGEAIDEDEEDEESEEVEDDDDGDRIDGIRDTNKIRNGGNGSPCRDQHISILCKHSGAKRAPYRVEGRAQGNVPDARDIEEDGEDERNDGKRNRSGVGVCAITDSDEMSDDSYNQKQRKKHHRS